MAIGHRARHRSTAKPPDGGPQVSPASPWPRWCRNGCPAREAWPAHRPHFPVHKRRPLTQRRRRCDRGIRRHGLASGRHPPNPISPGRPIPISASLGPAPTAVWYPSTIHPAHLVASHPVLCTRPRAYFLPLRAAARPRLRPRSRDVGPFAAIALSTGPLIHRGTITPPAAPTTHHPPPTPAILPSVAVTNVLGPSCRAAQPILVPPRCRGRLFADSGHVPDAPLLDAGDPIDSIRPDQHAPTPHRVRGPLAPHRVFAT